MVTEPVYQLEQGRGQQDDETLIFNSQPTAPGLDEAKPGFSLNGHTIYASSTSLPDELVRTSTGTSIAEPGSILDEESGRTFHNHATGTYFFPNDAAEQDRLDLQHHLFRLYHWGRLYRAPVQSPLHVLDIGTGTGIWSIQFAKEHPEARIVGTDLSLIQPLNAPDNCSFVKENSEYDEWIVPDPLDFVFMRLVNSCFDHHLTVFKKAFDSLKPGGWIEIHDATFEFLCTDGSCTGSHIERWSQLILQSADVVGRDFLAPQKYKQWLMDAGFVDVVEDVGPLPGNPWPTDARNKDLGRWQVANFYRGLRGISWKLLRAGGMSAEEVEVFIEKVKSDLTNVDLHFCFPIYTLYGRKPYPGHAAEG